MTLKEDFELVKHKLQMDIYEIQGKISGWQNYLKYFEATLRIVEEEEKRFIRKK